MRRLPIDFGDEPMHSVPIRQYRLTTASLARQSRFNAPFRAGLQRFNGFNPQSATRNNRKSVRGFTLVEILVVLVLLSLIVFALMAVFSSAQRAFRASITQTDVLEGGRAVMDLIADDLQTMTPCDYPSNWYNLGSNLPANLFISDYQFSTPYPPTPLYQPLIGSASGAKRTNLLENIYILSKGNLNGVPTWIGTGYSVGQTLPDGTLYPLYRFYMTTNVSSGAAGIAGMCNAFLNFNYTNSTNWSHLIDGVIGLTARVYDTNGVLMTNGYINPNIPRVQWVYFSPGMNGDGLTDSVFFSNALPVSVQVEMATLEDRTLAHAEGLSGVNQSNYLANAAAHVHLFRQRVWIRNLDITAYQ